MYFCIVKNENLSFVRHITSIYRKSLHFICVVAFWCNRMFGWFLWKFAEQKCQQLVTQNKCYSKILKSKTFTQLHLTPPTSTHLHLPPPSSFQPPPISIYLHPAHSASIPSLQHSNVIRIKILQVIGQFP